MQDKSDFDLDALAAYLHLTPKQVGRMADRGRLPGRKVGGQWHFSQAEIHHWLEDRIGVSDDEELVEVETFLDDDRAPEPEVSIIDLIPDAAVAIPLEARTPRSVIVAMTELGVNAGLLWDGPKMAEAVRARESLHPTALDNGVALLHPRRPMPNILAEGFLALGRTGNGIPFGGGSLTDIFFLICSTSEREHLRILARLSRVLKIPGLVEEIRNASDWSDIKKFITAQQGQL